MVAPKTSRRTRVCWLFAVLLLSLSNLGCSPAALSFLLMPFVDDREQPKCKLASADKKKEVTVAIAARFSNLEVRPEMQAFELELCECLVTEMKRRATENKEKVKFVPTSKVRSVLSRGGETVSLQELGQKTKADYVINLDINSLELYEKGSMSTLFRGNTVMSLTVVDVAKEHGEGTMHQELVRHQFPAHHKMPVDAGNSSIAEFRGALLQALARDLTRYFFAYQREEKWRGE